MGRPATPHPLAYLDFFFGVCERALAAAVLEAEEVRPSRMTLLAAEAAFALVCFLLFVTIDSLVVD